MSFARLTTRRLMTAVAVVAVVLALGLWVQELRARRARYATWSSRHAASARQWVRLAERNRREPGPFTIPAGMLRDPKHRAAFLEFRQKEEEAWRVRRGPTIAAQFRQARYHSWLAAKYRRAADRPWRALEPDPPPPK